MAYGKLTNKQALFVAAYMQDLNATKAAIAAGYSAKGASVRGSELLANRKVAEEIAKRTGEKFDELEISAGHVLREVARLAFYDPRKLYDESGNLKPIPELDANTVAAIAGFEVSELFDGRGEDRRPIGRLKKIRCADRGANLERLMKYLKLFSEQSEGSKAVSITVQVNHINATPRPVPAEQEPHNEQGVASYAQPRLIQATIALD